MRNFCIALSTKWLLDIVFIYVIRPRYGNEPYFQAYGTFDSSKWIIATALTIIICLFIQTINTTGRRVSPFFINTYFFLIIIPTLVLFGAQDRPYFHIILLCGSFVWLVGMVSLTPPIIIRPPSKTVAATLVALGLTLLFVVYGGLLGTGGLERFNFNFRAVYGVREQYNEALLPGFGYLVPWAAYIVNIAFLIFFYAKKKWSLVLLTLAGQLILFGMTNFKSFLFVPFVALSIAALRERLSLSALLGVGITAALAAGLVIFSLGEWMAISLVRRAFFVPAAMHGIYFDYFSVAPSGMLSGTRFAGLFASPYGSTTVVELIADMYWGRKINPNVGWVGDAFAQFGWYGVFAYATILAGILKVADGLAGGIDQRCRAVEGLLVGPAIALFSSSLTAALLTHGLLVLLISLWALARYLRPI